MGWFAITVISVLVLAVAVEGILIYVLALALGKLIFEHGTFMKAVFKGFAAVDQNFLNVGKTFRDLAAVVAPQAEPKLPDLPPTSGSFMN